MSQFQVLQTGSPVCREHILYIHKEMPYALQPLKTGARLLSRQNYPMATTLFHNFSVLPKFSYMHIQCILWTLNSSAFDHKHRALSLLNSQSLCVWSCAPCSQVPNSFPIKTLGIVPSFIFSYISHILHIGPCTKVSFNLHPQSILSVTETLLACSSSWSFLQVQCVCVHFFIMAASIGLKSSRTPMSGLQ